MEDRNGCETAILLTSATEPDAADLIIFSNRRSDAPQEVLALTRNIAFSGPLFGQAPFLEPGPNGALLLHEEQIGIGRTPWTNTLTIVSRDDGLVVAGQTYATYDRIVNDSYSCDVNLLKGDWTSAADRVDSESDETTYDVSQSGQIAPTRPALRDWSWSRGLPAPCEASLDAWFNTDPG